MTGCSSYIKPTGVALEKAKRVLGKVVPTPAGMHDRLQAYDFLSIVYDRDTLVAYLSRKCVPAGVEVTNREYWQPLNVSGYQDDNVITIDDRNVSGQLIPYTLETVLPTIAKVARKQGALLTFFSLEGGSHWEIWQFFGLDVSDWEDTTQWRTIYNTYTKFAGWYNTVDELYHLYVGDIDGKYALIGPTLEEAQIYQGTDGGWLPLDINFYQKLINDFLNLADEGEVQVDNMQRAVFHKLFDNTWTVRPYTLFNVKSNITTEYGKLKLLYPRSIYHDASFEESVGNPELRSITVAASDLADLDLKFSAGTWDDITNKGTAYSNTNKMTSGHLTLMFDTDPAGALEIKVDGDIVRSFNNGIKVACDGDNHTIEIYYPEQLEQ